MKQNRVEVIRRKDIYIRKGKKMVGEEKGRWNQILK